MADDPAECNDLAEAQPEKLAELQEFWWKLAREYDALPLQADRGFSVGRPPQIPDRVRTNTAPARPRFPKTLRRT